MNATFTQLLSLVDRAQTEHSAMEEKYFSALDRINQLSKLVDDQVHFALDHFDTDLPAGSKSPTYQAMQAVVVMHFGTEDDRVHYLKDRGWTIGASGWWTNRPMGFEGLLFAKAVETQLKSDLSPFSHLLDAIRPKAFASA